MEQRSAPAKPEASAQLPTEKEAEAPVQSRNGPAQQAAPPQPPVPTKPSTPKPAPQLQTSPNPEGVAPPQLNLKQDTEEGVFGQVVDKAGHEEEFSAVPLDSPNRK